MSFQVWLITAAVTVVLCCASSVSGNGGFFFGRQQPPQPHHECEFTRYPSLCVETLVEVTQKNDVVSALVNKTIVETTKLYASPLFNIETSMSSHGLSKAVSASCKDLLTMSLRRLDQSREALRQSRLKNKPDIQTWLSAALTFQQTCKDELARTHGLEHQISDHIDYVSQLCSNSLALVNRIVNDRRSVKESHQGYVPSQTDHTQHFPNWVSSKDRKLLQSTTVKANAVVAKDGSGHYETVSEAIAAASGGQFVIYVKSGVYKEKIRTNKDGITLIGDGKYSTIIQNDDSVGGDGTSLSGSATFAMYGDRFIARDIGFQNNAGPGGDQAIALTVSSDRAVLFRCSIAGYQDTLYALALRQFYRECDIYGTVDFIFGNAAAVFQSCDLILRKPGNKAYNVILASGRSDPGQNTGFSVQKCGIKPGPDFSGSVPSYLGRPWKDYSRSVVMESTIDKTIASRGWIEWPGSGGSVLKTLYFAEYGNEGPGSGTSGRVKWSGFHILDPDEASAFTVGSFISGTSWLPSTGVTFVSGLH